MAVIVLVEVLLLQLLHSGQRSAPQNAVPVGGYCYSCYCCYSCACAVAVAGIAVALSQNSSPYLPHFTPHLALHHAGPFPAPQVKVLLKHVDQPARLSSVADTVRTKLHEVGD